MKTFVEIEAFVTRNKSLITGMKMSPDALTLTLKDKSTCSFKWDLEDQGRFQCLLAGKPYDGHEGISGELYIHTDAEELSIITDACSPSILLNGQVIAGLSVKAATIPPAAAPASAKTKGHPPREGDDFLSSFPRGFLNQRRPTAPTSRTTDTPLSTEADDSKPAFKR